MDLELDGLHVLVTGGSKGIGLACAQGFLREGARVSLVSRSRASLDQAGRLRWPSRRSACACTRPT